MATLPQKLPWEMAQTRWAQELNPVLANPILQGLQLTNVKLVSGTNVINHLLGQTQQGWFLTDINGAATVYRSAAFNNLTLTLTSSAACTVNLWVY